MPRGYYNRKPKREVAEAVHDHNAVVPVEDPIAIPNNVPEWAVRFAVLANRRASPIETMIINHSLELPLLSGAPRTKAIGELRQLLDQVERMS